MEEFMTLLRRGRLMGASDIHLKVGQPPIFRVGSKLTRQDHAAITHESMQTIIHQMVPEQLQERLHSNEELDFAWAPDNDARYRVNLFLSSGEPTLALRHVKSDIPSFEELNLPVKTFAKIADSSRGIVIVAGATGHGKSTSLAAMLQHINSNTTRRVITIEDPVEYQFVDHLAVISQREVGLDTPSFQHGIISSLRQDPDVIMVGEMRNQSSFEAALTASETGHLIFSTLHADNAIQAINRILEIFPHEEQTSILNGLANNLRAIICQRLLPDTEGGVRPGLEIMLNNSVVKKLISDGDLNNLSTAINNGLEDGMITFDRSIFNLINEGHISEEVGMRNATNPDALSMNLKGIFIESGKRIIGR